MGRIAWRVSITVQRDTNSKRWLVIADRMNRKPKVLKVTLTKKAAITFAKKLMKRRG